MHSIIIDTAQQQLALLHGGKEFKKYIISSASNGTGQEYGSEQTPLGEHLIRAKIGVNCPVNTVFIARRPTGEIYSPALATKNPERDWILTRILWLCGREPGKNRFGQVDTLRRKIYIHGTPDKVQLGAPGSHGCIRMANTDIIELFDLIKPGIRVSIA